jgi:hypothetical protein
VGMKQRPTIVVLCGSTRFYEDFQRANFTETMAGKIVLTVGFYPHANTAHGPHGEQEGIALLDKVRLDILHLQKIDMADEVLVLNRDGYTGDSTRREVAYAYQMGKVLRWLEPDKMPLKADVQEWVQQYNLQEVGA